MVTINFFYLALLPSLAWATTITVDDNDPQIKFDGSWSIVNDHTLDGGISTNYYGGATHASTTHGGQLSFVFTGNKITYYGDVDIDNADFIIQIDGTSSTHSAKSSGFNSNQVLFTVSGLPNTQHTFIVTHNGANGEWATLDRLVYESDIVLTNAAGATVQGVTLTGGLVLPSSSVSNVSATRQPQSPQSQQALPLGAIIGIAVGGAIFLVALLVFLFIFLRRRRRMHANVQATQDADYLHTQYPPPQAPVSQWIPSPFTLAPATENRGNYAVVPIKPQNPAPVVPSLLPPSYDDILSHAPPSSVARSSTYDPYAETDSYGASSSAYAPSDAGFAPAPATSSTAQRTYPVDRKIRPT